MTRLKPAYAARREKSASSQYRNKLSSRRPICSKTWRRTSRQQPVIQSVSKAEVPPLYVAGTVESYLSAHHPNLPPPHQGMCARPYSHIGHPAKSAPESSAPLSKLTNVSGSVTVSLFSNRIQSTFRCRACKIPVLLPPENPKLVSVSISDTLMEGAETELWLEQPLVDSVKIDRESRPPIQLVSLSIDPSPEALSTITISKSRQLLLSKLSRHSMVS